MAIRVGIVGQRGNAFVAGLRAHPSAEMTAFCEINEPRLQELGAKHGVENLFTRYEEMLDHVDAVVVATPMQLHAEQAIQALHAGKHVLSEVTAAVSLEECWRIVDAVEASGKTYMFSENYCYIKSNVLVREMVRKGLFGEPYYGEGEYLHDCRAYHHLPDGSPTWRYYWQVGTNGCTYPTHSLGPVMQWFNAANPGERIEFVTCLGSGRHADPEHPHEDTSILLCKLQSGKLARVRLDMMSSRPHQLTYYGLQGTKGVYEASRIQGQPGHIWLGENIPGEEGRAWKPLAEFEEHLPTLWKNPPEAALKAGHSGGDYFIVHDWLEAITTGVPPPIDVYTGMEWTAAGLCSELSINNGGVPIKVPNFRDRTQRPVVLDGR
ncbi:MAG: Gfo/Idh/MocA family oxidoreductase [Armatimonadaceae bacterium]